MDAHTDAAQMQPSEEERLVELGMRIVRAILMYNDMTGGRTPFSELAKVDKDWWIARANPDEYRGGEG